nr:peptidyl-tRNA hydrolase [Defluviimonas salinarum]
MRLYAVLRGDLLMSEGKANAQAGHAYIDALLLSLHSDDPAWRDRAAAYAALKPGTKVCLDGGSEEDLLRLAADLGARGIPHSLIVDRDHVELPDFDGGPVLTAIGIAPLARGQAPRLLRRLALWRGGKRARAPTASEAA